MLLTDPEGKAKECAAILRWEGWTSGIVAEADVAEGDVAEDDVAGRDVTDEFEELVNGGVVELLRVLNPRTNPNTSAIIIIVPIVPPYTIPFFLEDWK